MNYVEDFLDVFNYHYPFEKYILLNPKPIGNLFDDALLTEIFVPHCEKSDELIDSDGIYIEIKGKAGSMRFGFYDFNDGIMLNIMRIVIEDIGNYAYECLYIDNDDVYETLKPILERQKELITEKYGECVKKKNNYLVDFCEL
jgi:hypothetical protein